MKKKIWRRLLSAFTAVTLTASTFAAFSLPAAAEGNEPIEATAAIAASLRSSGSEWTTKHNNSKVVSVETPDTLEMTRKSDGTEFGAFYQFDPVNIPEGKVIKSVTLTINRGANFDKKYYNVFRVSNPADNTDIDEIFNLVAPALGNISETLVGVTTDGEASSGASGPFGTVTLDITDGFDIESTNSYFVMRSELEDNKRQLLADAKITIEYTDILESGGTVTASVSAQLRASSDTWEGQNTGSSKFVSGTENIETTATNNFGAFYYFDCIPLPEDSIITKATLAIYQGSSKFSGRPFVVLHTETPEDISDITKVFAVVKPARDNEDATKAGATTMTELKDDANNRTESVEITDCFDANKPNSYFLYNQKTDDSGNRQLSARAEITVEYVNAEASVIHEGTTTKYAKLEEAYSNAEAGDTIKLLNDATTTKGIYFNKGNLTIDGNGKTIHNGSNYIAFEGSGELTVSNLTIDGTGNLEIKDSTTINADNLTISHLQINGSTIESKGTVKNSEITDTLKCFAKLTIQDTNVKNIVFPDVKYGSGDAPKITSNKDFGAESIVVEKVTKLEDAGTYTLFDGDYIPSSITITSPYDETYTYAEGIIRGKADDTDYEASLTNDGTTTKYETLAEAISAVKSGDTIKLLKDVTIKRFIFGNTAYSESNTDKCNISNVTIDGDNQYSIISDGTQGMLFEVDGKEITFKNITLKGGNNYTINMTGDESTKVHLQNVSFEPTSGKPAVRFGANAVMLYADAETRIGKLRINAEGATGDVVVYKESGSANLTADVVSELTYTESDTTGKEVYVNSNGDLAIKNVGEEPPADNEPAYTVTIDDSIAGKITTAVTKADAADKITVTVAGDNYVANSLIASYNDGSSTNAISLTGSGGTYSFTMPAANVTLYALFDDDETTTIVASDDYCYNVQAQSANKGHYIRNQSDNDEKNLALGFDLGDLDISDKIVKLQIVKTGYSSYSATVVNLISGNPWETSDFNYTLASGASTNVVADGGEDGSNGQYYKCTYTLDSSKLTKVGNKLYLNVERAEQASGQAGNDYFAIPTAQADNGKKASKAEYLPKLIITEPKYYNIETRSGITVDEKAIAGTKVTISAKDIVKDSLIVKNVAGNSVVETTDQGNGTYTFTMPESDISISGLENETNKIYVVPTSVTAVNAAGNATNNYYIKGDHALGMTFDIPELPEGKELDSVTLHFTRSNSAASQLTNVYDQTSKSGFIYPIASDEYIAQYNGGTIAAKKLASTPSQGTYKLLLTYDSSVGDVAGNDYYVVGADNSGCLPRDTSQLPYLVFTFKAAAQDLPEKKAPIYELQTDELNNMFQYHFAGGTTVYNDSDKTDDSGKAYDVYIWVPNNVAPGELKGLVAIKMNLVEVPFAYSQHLRDALKEKGFGILFLVCQKDPYGYNNTLNGFYTRTDSDGNDTIYAGGTYTDNNGVHNCRTTDGKDAAQIMNELLEGIAEASGYSEIATKTPLITIGHSAASGFGNKSANWNKDRVIAQIHMKNGMSGGEAMVPGVPQLQYAAQYTEHAMGADRDRSVRDARYHITNKRAKNTDYLVSHIIEWGSGHYDWSENATYMLTEYIKKAIDARLPDDYDETGKLNDLTNTGYLMKPFAKTGNGAEQDAGYYRDYLQGWLSDGKDNNGASNADKKASFWFFDEDFAKLVNEFTNYAIPESPDSTATGISGATYSDIEPFMLMKNPSESTYATTPVTANTVIAPYTTFASNPFSRYASMRFINYTKLASPNATTSANLQGYGTVTVDTYYMNKIPTITAGGSAAYDGAGENDYVPKNTKAEFVPLIAPYEVVSSEQIDMSDMTKSGDESENVASVTRTTLRFHNDRVYFRSGNLVSLKKQYSGFTYEDNGPTKEFGVMDSYGFIKSPELRGANGFVTAAFKATSAQINVPYVATGKGTDQTLTLDEIDDVNVNGETENPKFAVSYTSNDEDLQKFTDVFVEYGPARAVRSGNETDGYAWEIEVLLDQIPKNATYPIEVNVVASNLGKWEKVSGATAAQTFNIIWGTAEITGITVTPNSGTYTGVPVEAVTVTGAASDDTVTYKLDDGEFSATVPTVTEVGEYEVTVKVTRDGYADFEKTVTVIIREPSGGFGEDYAPSDIKGVNEYDDTTPLSGWFSNDEEEKSEAVNSVRTEGGQLIMSNGEDSGYGNLWIGKRYATQKDAEEAAKIIIKFRYTPGNTDSRIYLASASAADVKAGLDSDTVEGAYKTAAELGMAANKTYDVVVTINNSKHRAVFAVTENVDISPMSVSLMAYVDLTAEVPDDTNTVIFRPAAGATDSLDYFSAELLSEAKPALRIGEITQSADKTTVQVSVENPTYDSDAGVMIAALYSLDGVLKEIKTDVSGTVEFNKATEGYIKLFLWKSLSGEGAIQPILPSDKKTIPTN